MAAKLREGGGVGAVLLRSDDAPDHLTVAAATPAIATQLQPTATLPPGAGAPLAAAAFAALLRADELALDVI